MYLYQGLSALGVPDHPVKGYRPGLIGIVGHNILLALQFHQRVNIDTGQLVHGEFDVVSGLQVEQPQALGFGHLAAHQPAHILYVDIARARDIVGHFIRRPVVVSVRRDHGQQPAPVG